MPNHPQLPHTPQQMQKYMRETVFCQTQHTKSDRANQSQNQRFTGICHDRLFPPHNTNCQRGASDKIKSPPVPSSHSLGPQLIRTGVHNDEARRFQWFLDSIGCFVIPNSPQHWLGPSTLFGVEARFSPSSQCCRVEQGQASVSSDVLSRAGFSSPSPYSMHVDLSLNRQKNTNTKFVNELLVFDVGKSQFRDSLGTETREA